MPERDITFTAGAHYHLYNRGNNREPVFFEAENYLFFLRRLRVHLMPVLDVVAYCLMPTHYHLLVCLKGEGLSRAMQRFTISYTKAMNKRYDRVGALFQGAFQAKPVDTDAYLAHLSRYIHLNPVLSGLGAAPEEWPYSSYAEYIGLRDGTLPRPDVVLDQFPDREAYRAFVDAYVPDERQWIESLLFE